MLLVDFLRSHDVTPQRTGAVASCKEGPGKFALFIIRRMGERHKVRNIQFRIFQNHQDKYADVLRGRPIWLAFARSRETVGDESVFLGAYEGDSAALTGHVGGVAEWMFDKRLSPLLEEFRGRLVIDWTGGAINWVIAPTNDFPYINVVSEHNSVGIAPPPNRKWAEQDIGFPSSPSPLRPLNSATLSPFEGDVTSPDATAAWERTQNRSNMHQRLIQDIETKATDQASLGETAHIDIVVDSTIFVEVQSIIGDVVGSELSIDRDQDAEGHRVGDTIVTADVERISDDAAGWRSQGAEFDANEGVVAAIA